MHNSDNDMGNFRKGEIIHKSRVTVLSHDTPSTIGGYVCAFFLISVNAVTERKGICHRHTDRQTGQKTVMPPNTDLGDIKRHQIWYPLLYSVRQADIHTDRSSERLVANRYPLLRSVKLLNSFFCFTDTIP